MLTEAASARIATLGRSNSLLLNGPGIKVALIGPNPSSLSPELPLPPPRDVTRARITPGRWRNWGLRDIVDYELISGMALLELGTIIAKRFCVRFTILT